MDCKSGCGGRLQVRGDQAFATCPKCRKGNCLKCEAVHEGKSCRQYQMSIRPKGSPEKTTAQNRSPAVSSPFASGPEKSPGQAPYPAAPPVVANDDDSSEKLVQCHVHECAGQAFVDKEDAMFRCPLCGHFNCLKCEAVHESMTCAEYENNQGSVASVVLKPSRQSEEGSEEDEEEQQAADDDAEGIIVECRFGNCKGYSFVIKTATIAQCELCHHWTCVSCKACHESQSCAQYKGIDVPEVSRPKPKNSAGSTAHGFMSTVKTTITKMFASSDSLTGEELPVETPDVVRSTNNGGFYTGTVSGARGHTEHKKVQEECRFTCDSCCSRRTDHVAQECEHALCSYCIQISAERATTQGSISCPARTGNSQPCSGLLQEEEYKQHVPQAILKKMGRKSNWCDTACFDKRCSHTFRRRNEAQFFICPLCRRVNCAECQAVHEGMTCEQHIEKLVADMDSGKLEDPEEKKKRLVEHVALYEQPSLPTAEEFECCICLVEVEPGKGIVLRNCHHQICEQCLEDTAKNSPVAEVLCPCKTNDVDCQMPVFDSDLRACLSKEDYAALQERGLREAENTSKEPSFHCKTPDCKGWCLHERDVEVFTCPVCKQRNCLRCEAIHNDMSCADYQADLKRKAENDEAARASLNFLEEMLKTEQAMRCPQCRVVIIKRSGCDYMVCTSCRTQLCWATKGARWGPKGQGDISGGCKCGVNGKKCHPRCTTCH